jgi:hypothetical protein
VQNATPADEPPYIAGPHPLSHSVAGEYNGILLVTLPGATRAASVDNERRVAIYGRDGPSRVIGIVVDLRRGAQRAVVVRFEPPRIDRVTIVPSARVAPTRWHIGHTTFGDRLKYVAKW